jgi:hypothetical protein
MMAASQAKKGRSNAPPRAGPVLTAAAWSEADLALADAMQADARAASVLSKVRRGAARAQSPKLAEHAATLEVEIFALRQALARAAKQRGFTTFAKTGDEVAFDARRHRLVRGEAARGAPVRVLFPGIQAGDRILVPAEVRRIRKSSE